MTAVHAIHLHTGKLLMFHGEADQRVMTIDPLTYPTTPPLREPLIGEVRWTPLFYQADEFSPNSDLFCSGHAQLADGTVMVGGGNIDGDPLSGGLDSMFRYLPPDFVAGDPSLDCPFQWDLEPDPGPDPWINPHDTMDHDRWYPTLTTLRDGRVLIAGGYSRAFGGGTIGTAASSNLIEIYDPATQQVTGLNPDGDVTFFSNEGYGNNPPTVPNYPFMFQLPNGDVLYAGGESPADPVDTAEGRVLVAPANSANNRWEWANDRIPSQITGGSAVMFLPGVVLKTGGRAVNQDEDGFPGVDDGRYQTARAEVIDLSGIPGGVDAYQGLELRETDAMNTPRHYHNTVVLPNGRVVVVGGASAGNGEAGDRWENPCCTGGPPAPAYDATSNPAGVPSKFACEQGGIPVIEQECLDGCASSCETYYELSPNAVCNNNVQLATNPDTRCAYLEAISCCAGRGAGSCTEVTGCEFVGGTCVDAIPGLQSGDRCADAMPGAACVDGRCEKSCDQNADPATECPPIMPVGSDNTCLLVADELAQAYDPEAADETGSGPFEGFCEPANNECFAAYMTEVWDPACEVWTDADAQTYPRLYHSTALLLPDGRVMSTGGGHRDARPQGVVGGYRQMNDYPFMEYFEPDYGGVTKPVLELVDEAGDLLGPDEEAYLPWYADDPGLDVTLPGGLNVQTIGDVAYFSIVRLGSTTHGFDQDQRYARLSANLVSDSGVERSWVVRAPEYVEDGAGRPLSAPDTILPPGYYMLFAVTTQGVPSLGRYVRVGSDPTIEGLCAAGSGTIAASVTECTGEPLAGACSPADQVTNSFALPTTTDGAGAPVDGWRVVLERGASPETLAALCAQTCEQHFGGISGASANCNAPGAFTTSVLQPGTPGTIDMLVDSQRSAPDAAGNDQLECDLGQDCWAKFDEGLQLASAKRLTPAAAALGVGEESILSLDGSALSLSCGANASARFELFGQAGISDAAREDPLWDSPFYLGSLDLQAPSPGASPLSEVVDLTCADGTQDSVTVDDVRVSLVQPAFGVAPRGSDEATFGPTALQLWIEVTVDGSKYVARRPNPAAWTFDRTGGGLDAAPTNLQAIIACGNSSWAELRLALDVDSGPVLASPPTASIGMPTSVTCGDSVDLRGTFGDPDGDLDKVRWEVDRVRISDSVSEVRISETHEVRAIAVDARGATTTAEHTIGCN